MLRTRNRRSARLLAAGAAVTLAATVLPGTANAQVRDISSACEDVPSGPFTDVGAPGSVLERNVSCIFTYGVARGTSPTRYTPGANLNRGQMAMLVYNLLDQVFEMPDAEGIDNPFPDVSGVYETAVLVLWDEGIIDGRADGSYGTLAPITRAQSTKLIALALDWAEADFPEPFPTPFTDLRGSAFSSFINGLAAIGVVQGTTATTFSPNASLTRGQMAYVMARSLAVLVDDEIIDPWAPPAAEAPPALG
jgi:hypothetical protein